MAPINKYVYIQVCISLIYQRQHASITGVTDNVVNPLALEMDI